MTPEEVDNNIVFECLAGSKAYGTSTPESDTDIRGVCIPDDPAYYIGMGLKKFFQKDSGWPNNEDKVIYDFRKAFRLMADNNPNMLELLYTDPKHYIVTGPIWEMVLEKRDLFLSKKVRHTFGGYAYSQLKRIQRHRGYLMNPPASKPTRKDFGLPEKKLISSEEKGAIEWLIAKFLRDSLEWAKLSQELQDELLGVNYIGVVQSKIPEETKGELQKYLGFSDGVIEAIFKEKRYDNALKGWKSYNSWKNERNPKRQEIEAKFGFDTKHAMHLVRLMRMGEEILETKKVNVFRPDREELLSIRNGAWSYEQVVEFAENYDKRLSELYKKSELPREPKRNKIDELCQEVLTGWVFGI